MDDSDSDSGSSGAESSPGEDESTGSSEEATTGDPEDESGDATADGSTGVDLPSLPSCPDGTEGCVAIDLLVVVDNSATMLDKQAKIALALPALVERLGDLHMADGTPIAADVQVMITTTDLDNPYCTETEGYLPAGGEPVATGCNARIEQFTGVADPSQNAQSACTDACPLDVAAASGIVSFRSDDPSATNVPLVPPLDIDGDGDAESAVQRALACMAPQGVVGCGYESQLESMLQSLNPMASWNDGAAPFLRPDSILAIAIFTDEADCSIRDYSIMDDPAYWNTDPSTGSPGRSSALCWNAGVECVGPDASGAMFDCVASEGPMHDVGRYSQLFDYYRSVGKEVVMLGVAGVPPVVGYESTFPHLPSAGGVDALSYRTWLDAPYPVGDIAQQDFDNGMTAADQSFALGLAGPGCHATNAAGETTGFGLPPVRLREVCQALDYDDEDGGARCCLESICDNDYSSAMGCLGALIENTFTPR